MVFSSFIFLFLFLPIFLVCYFFSGRRFRNLTALAFSFLFYGWGAPSVLIMLFFSSAADYYISKFIDKSPRGKFAFAVGVILNVALLLYYKYTNFFFGEFNTLLAYLEHEPIHWTQVLLPVGVSFFTFQKISYLGDVYRGLCVPAAKLSDYLLYVVLFPQLIAGPIVRYHDVDAQIKQRSHSFDMMFSGIVRFCIGLGKKVLIADEMGRITDNVFALNAGELYTWHAWVGLLAYAFQIYFDFSGYSDMAIGLGRMMGFEFLENFNFPYISQNITEFWRRWHLSLSRWMLEYLYIPLGGSRVSKVRMYCNLWLVFIVSGLWHGASWNFLIWGIYHGFFLVLDKVFWIRISSKIPKIINVMICFFIVLIGWVFFRIENLSHAIQFLETLFGLSNSVVEPSKIYRAQIIHNRGIFVMIVAMISSFAPLLDGVRVRVTTWWHSRSDVLQTNFAFAVSFALFILSVTSLSTNEFSPFLYFKF